MHNEMKDSVSKHARQDNDEDADSIKHALVWIKKDSSLVAKKIITGLNNETDVQVLSGLSTGDEIVTGYQSLAKGLLSKKVTEKSPFPAAAAGQVIKQMTSYRQDKLKVINKSKKMANKILDIQNLKKGNFKWAARL